MKECCEELLEKATRGLAMLTEGIKHGLSEMRKGAEQRTWPEFVAGLRVCDMLLLEELVSTKQIVTGISMQHGVRTLITSSLVEVGVFFLHSVFF